MSSKNMPFIERAWELGHPLRVGESEQPGHPGRKAQDFSLVLNWYLNPSLRFMLDYTRVLDVSHALGVKWNPEANREADDLDIVQMRGQLVF